MTRRLPLSALASLIQETFEEVFSSTSIWVIAEITDVKKNEAKRWCFLKFIEKKKDQITTEMQGVFWANGFQEIEKFEALTQQPFASGLEVSCRVVVKFHPRYGLKLEVQEIDANYTLGQMELQRQQTLDALLRQFPGQIQLVDGEYLTANKKLPVAQVLQRVALVGAPDSDGFRDFVQELMHNPYGYQFLLTTFSASVQGMQAATDICNQLDAIKKQHTLYHVVAIVRGGGSNTDFAAFDDATVAQRIALFPIPVFTGIGHDRNTSISDLMGWQFKTPTKAAAAIVDTAHHTALLLQQQQQSIEKIMLNKWRWHQQHMQLWNNKMQVIIPHRINNYRSRLKDWQHAIHSIGKEQMKHFNTLLKEKEYRLQHAVEYKLAQQKILMQKTSLLVEKLSPESILNRGFALVMQENKIVTNAAALQQSLPMQTILKETTISSKISAIETHE